MVEWSQNSTLAHLCSSCYEWSSLYPVLCKLREGNAANQMERSLGPTTGLNSAVSRKTCVLTDNRRPFVRSALHR